MLFPLWRKRLILSLMGFFHLNISGFIGNFENLLYKPKSQTHIGTIYEFTNIEDF
jgi:hypothetical protein